MGLKLLSLFVSILIAQILFAQKKEKFYDYQSRECGPDRARFYATIEQKDSGWVRYDYYLPSGNLQMKGLYKDSACKVKNGLFYYFYPDKKLESFGKYTDNKKDSTWLSYHTNGRMKDSTEYDYGEKTGTSLSWHSNGYISDSVVYKSSGTAIAVSWFDDGTVSSAGRLNLIGLNNGRWQYFHRNGKLSADETYDNGRLVKRTYFSELGVPFLDTTDKSHPASFPGGIGAWSKYLGKNLYWPANYRIVNGDKVEINAQFTIDEYGNIKDIYITIPFEAPFNDIVMKTIKGSPKWEPALSHNRKVAYRHIQTVIFTQVRD
jgi:antitoxin component YwqK of YwqJK toxin-antitoxin module